MRTLILFIALVSSWSALAASSEIGIPFYKVEYEGRVSWLLGTIHTNQISVKEYPGILEALSKAKVFIGEFDPHKGPSPLNIQHYLPSSQTLDSFLEPQQAKTLRKFIAIHAQKYWHVPLDQTRETVDSIMKLRPGIAYEAIMELTSATEEEAARSLGIHPAQDQALDHQLYQQAEQKSVPIKGFRDPDFAREQFFSRHVSIKDLKKIIDHDLNPDGTIQAKYIRNFIEFRRMQESHLSGFVDLYKRGAPYAELRKYQESFLNGNEDINTPLQKLFNNLTEKAHADWVPEVVNNVKRGNAFMAVGVAHVAGENSLLESLNRQLGTTVKVTRINPLHASENAGCPRIVIQTLRTMINPR